MGWARGGTPGEAHRPPGLDLIHWPGSRADRARCTGTISGEPPEPAGSPAGHQPSSARGSGEAKTIRCDQRRVHAPGPPGLQALARDTRDADAQVGHESFPEACQPCGPYPDYRGPDLRKQAALIHRICKGSHTAAHPELHQNNYNLCMAH